MTENDRPQAGDGWFDADPEAERDQLRAAVALGQRLDRARRARAKLAARWRWGNQTKAKGTDHA